jgi:hypothetical protein
LVALTVAIDPRTRGWDRARPAVSAPVQEPQRARQPSAGAEMPEKGGARSVQQRESIF